MVPSIRSAPLLAVSVLGLPALALAQAPGELLLPPTPVDGGGFGVGVDLDGDTLVVSTGSGGLNGPAGYSQVFSRSGSQWVLDATLQVPGGGTGGAAASDVGYDVDLLGDDLLVGVPDHGTDRRGAVVLYRRTAGVWGPGQVLPHPLAAPSRSFGTEVALGPDVALVACPRDDNSRGAVYTFERSAPGAPWTPGPVLRDPSGVSGDFFGFGLALEGNRAAVVGGGEVLVFERTSGSWSLTDRIADPAGVGFFEVDLEGDLMAAGGWGGCGHAGGSCGPGAATVIRDVPGAGWVVGERLESPFAPYRDAFFGAEVAIEDGRILVGHWGETDIFSTYSQGGAVLYEDLGQGYEFTQRLVPPSRQLAYGSGAVMALDGDRAALGLFSYGDAGVDSGAVSLHRLGPATRFVCDGRGCPCGNDLPSQGCANSVTDPTLNRAGALRAAGSTSAAADDLVLWIEELPPATFGLVAMGRVRPGAGAPLGDGLLCLDPAQPLHRFPVRQADAIGAFTEGPGLAAYAATRFGPSGAITAGTTWTFQAWYRDAAGPCGGGSNLTSGVEVTFGP